MMQRKKADSLQSSCKAYLSMNYVNCLRTSHTPYPMGKGYQLNTPYPYGVLVAWSINYLPCIKDAIH